MSESEYRGSTRAVMRYETRKRLPGTIAFALLLSGFVTFVVTLFPSISEAAVDIDAFLESLPEALREGISAESYSTIEGFLATEFYLFAWVLLLGLYLAYSAGGLLAEDVETGRLYMVLSAPISRRSLALGKFGSVLVSIGLLNLWLPVIVFGSTIAVSHPVDPQALLTLHLASIPYLATCAGLGFLLSALAERSSVAERGAIALIFVLFLVDTVTVGTDYEELGLVSPTRYFDSTELLLEGTVDVGGILILTILAITLVMTSVTIFERSDV